MDRDGGDTYLDGQRWRRYVDGQRWRRYVDGQRWRSANTLCGGGPGSHKHQQLHCTAVSHGLCCITDDLNFLISR